MAARRDLEQVQRFALTGREEGEIEDFIAQLFIGNRTRIESSPDDAYFTVASTALNGVSANRTRSTVDYTAFTDPFEHLMFVEVGRGRVEFRGGGWDTDVQAGEVALTPVGVEMANSMFDIDVHTLQLPMDPFRAVASEIAGPTGADVRFESMRPVSDRMARHWTSVSSLAHAAIQDEDSVLAYPLLARDLVRTIAMAALHAFPNTTWTHREASAGRVGPASLRRAVAYMEENAHQPLELADVAAAAGTTARALQYAFMRHHDITPMAHLRRVRLEHAHRELQAADPADRVTVTQIARRWGFASASRFAHHYAAAYGCAPSQTLRS